MAPNATTGRAGVLFDIDGTLLDTNYLHVVAWSAAFQDNGFRVQMADIHRAIGLPSEALVQRLVGADRPDLIEAHSDNFGRLRAQYGARTTDGAADLLRGCAGLGRIVVLATSGGTDDLAWMRPTIDADDVIEGVTTSDDVQRGKPHPDVMVRAMEAHELCADRTVAVGDSVWDVRSAARAGIPCIGLTSGGIGELELRQAGAAEVYDDPGALARTLPTSLLGRGVGSEHSG